MVGPSSSHTAGAVQMGKLARQLFGGTPTHVICTYYESFAQTHKGHGTDYAIVSGILGFDTDDLRVPHALDIAQKQGLHIEFIEKEEDSPIRHANTADLYLKNAEREARVVAASVGGGTIELRLIEVQGLTIDTTGPLPMVAVVTDRVEYAREVRELLLEQQIIPIRTRVEEKENRLLYVYELDDVLSRQTKQVMEQFKRENTSVYILCVG